MAEDDDFDLDKLSIPLEILEEAKAAAEKTQRARDPVPRRFTQLPDSWFERLVSDAPRSAIVLAWLLLRLSWKARGRPFRLANGALDGLGMTRKTKYRALDELERRGLIEVRREPFKSPTIVLYNPKAAARG
jgi:hypothetical protein